MDYGSSYFSSDRDGCVEGDGGMSQVLEDMVVASLVLLGLIVFLKLLEAWEKR